MATIYETTMSPSKRELVTAWLPAQPWYRETGHEPELIKAGGFRLDDPEGEVGIEFMIVTDRSGATTYHTPMTYRGRALPGGVLIGTSEHGVLGLRWIYDGARDPVMVARLLAAIQGEAEPQSQNQSGTPDPTVTGQPVTEGPLAAIGSAVVANTPAGTDLQVETAPAGQLILRINRILQPDGRAPAGEPGPPGLSATWRLPDGTQVRGLVATFPGKG